MPVVPSSTVPSVAPTPNSGVPYQTGAGATPAAFGAEVGQAEQGLGKEFEQLGNTLATHALQMQEEVNASSAKDLFLEGDIKVGKLTVDYNNLEGINKVNAQPKYVQDIMAVRDELKAKAPNGDVARRFDQDFARRIGYSVVDSARGAATSLRQYNDQASAAVRSNTLSHIAANSQDDQRFAEETRIGTQTLKDSVEYKGMPPEAQEQKQRDYITGAWATRLQSMAKTDPLRARDLLAKNRGEMDGGKALQVEDTINQQIINVDTRVSSDNIIQSGALVSPELREAVKKFEGYSATPHQDYKQVSSGYGTKYDPNDKTLTPEQLKAVHEQRLDNELARAANIVDQFAPGLPDGTRNALIDLTYRAGSAWTSAGLGQSIRAGDFTTAQAKVREYNRAGGEVIPAGVARANVEADWFGGTPHESDPTSRLSLAMDKARERAAEVFPNDPGYQAKYLDTLQSRLRSDNSVMETAARQMQLEMRNRVQKELINDPSITTYDRLSPLAKQSYDQSPPSQQKVYDAQMRKNATADVPLTPERQSLYDTLRGEAITNPQKFVSRNLSSLDLPRAQISTLVPMQAKIEALTQKGIHAESVIKDSQSLLNDAGIRQSASDKGMNQEYMKFKGVLDQQIEQFVDENKRPPNAKEGRELVQGLVKDIVTSHGTFYDSHSRAYQAIADKTLVQVQSIDEARALPKGTTFVWEGQTRTRN